LYAIVRFFFSSRRRHTRSKRDGVQTCALPIFRRVCSFPAAVELSRNYDRERSGGGLERNTASRRMHLCRGQSSVCRPFVAIRVRSEERRVGTECRSWWSPGQYYRNHIRVLRTK